MEDCSSSAASSSDGSSSYNEKNPSPRAILSSELLITQCRNIHHQKIYVLTKEMASIKELIAKDNADAWAGHLRAITDYTKIEKKAALHMKKTLTFIVYPDMWIKAQEILHREHYWITPGIWMGMIKNTIPSFKYNGDRIVTMNLDCKKIYTVEEHVAKRMVLEMLIGACNGLVVGDLDQADIIYQSPDLRHYAMEPWIWQRMMVMKLKGAECRGKAFLHEMDRVLKDYTVSGGLTLDELESFESRVNLNVNLLPYCGISYSLNPATVGADQFVRQLNEKGATLSADNTVGNILFISSDEQQNIMGPAADALMLRRSFDLIVDTEWLSSGGGIDIAQYIIPRLPLPIFKDNLSLQPYTLCLVEGLGDEEIIIDAIKGLGGTVIEYKCGFVELTGDEPNPGAPRADLLVTSLALNRNNDMVITHGCVRSAFEDLLATPPGSVPVHKHRWYCHHVVVTEMIFSGLFDPMVVTKDPAEAISCYELLLGLGARLENSQSVDTGEKRVCFWDEVHDFENMQNFITSEKWNVVKMQFLVDVKERMVLLDMFDDKYLISPLLLPQPSTSRRHTSIMTGEESDWLAGRVLDLVGVEPAAAHAMSLMTWGKGTPVFSSSEIHVRDDMDVIGPNFYAMSEQSPDRPSLSKIRQVVCDKITRALELLQFQSREPNLAPLCSVQLEPGTGIFFDLRSNYMVDLCCAAFRNATPHQIGSIKGHQLNLPRVVCALRDVLRSLLLSCVPVVYPDLNHYALYVGDVDRGFVDVIDFASTSETSDTYIIKVGQNLLQIFEFMRILPEMFFGHNIAFDCPFRVGGVCRCELIFENSQHQMQEHWNVIPTQRFLPLHSDAQLLQSVQPLIVTPNRSEFDEVEVRIRATDEFVMGKAETLNWMLQCGLTRYNQIIQNLNPRLFAVCSNCLHGRKTYELTVVFVTKCDNCKRESTSIYLLDET